MTKSLALLLLTTIMLPLSFATERETRAHEKTVDIPDPALRRVITEHLKKPPDATITTLDMAALTTLHASRQKIQDLSGLEFATKLTDLYLGDNVITDVSPLCRVSQA